MISYYSYIIMPNYFTFYPSVHYILFTEFNILILRFYQFYVFIITTVYSNPHFD